MTSKLTKTSTPSSSLKRSFRLVTLGSSDAFNSGGRANSCFWVEDSCGNYLLDCGPTTPLALQRWREPLGLDLTSLDVIYLTHLHGDHIGGLPVLLLELNFNQLRTRSLTISGPPTTEERILTLCESAYPQMMTKLLNYEVSFIEHPIESEGIIAGRAVKSIAALHDPSAHPTSLSIDDQMGCRLVFSGDTGWNEALAKLSTNAEALILECSYSEAVFPGHLSLAEIARERFGLHPKRLILTHFGVDSRAEARRRQGELTIEVADDGVSWSNI